MPGLLRIGSYVVMALACAAFATFAYTQRADAGGGCHAPLTDERGVKVDLQGGCFLPTVLRVDVGTAVEFVNLDAGAHTVTGAGLGAGTGNGWGSYEEFGLDEKLTHTFDKPGVFPYVCILHPTMAGAIVVGDAVSEPAAGESPGESATPADDGGSEPAQSTILTLGGAIGVLGAGVALVTGTQLRRRWRR